MMGFPTFRGGVHPPQNKDLTRDKAIEDYRPKGELVFPMSQHIGAPNAPVVKKGDRVLVGTVLGLDRQADEAQHKGEKNPFHVVRY